LTNDEHLQLLPGVPYVESPFFTEIFNDDYSDKVILEIARNLNRDGFAIIDFPDPSLPDLAQNIISDLTLNYDFDNTDGGMRTQDAWKSNPSVKAIANNSEILRILEQLFGRKPFPFQTLNFPVGTQQHFHTDSIHFSCMPERFMCGVWVALEDVQIGSGPLEYYPGSHLWPIYTHEQLGIDVRSRPGSQEMYEKFWEKLIKSSGIERKVFYAKKGQALIWLSNLLHGGFEEVVDKKTRWSQVTHYYFENCIYFTPLSSTPLGGSVNYRNPPNILNDGHPEANFVLGKVVDKDILDFSTFLRKKECASVVLPLGFDPERYIALNPDLKRAGVDPVSHYLKYGFNEGRHFK
jgi:hypothetical protein